MINAVLYKASVGYTGFEFTGHAGHGEEGEDIVCAAVSSMAQFVIAGIIENGKIACGYEISDGRIYLTLPKEMKEAERFIADHYLKTLRIMLFQLSQQYNEYLKFSCLEV